MVTDLIDITQLNEFLKLPEIFNPSASDGASPDRIDFTPFMTDGNVYLQTSLGLDGRIVGFSYFRRKNEVTWEMHCGFLETHRGYFAKHELCMMLDNLFSKIPICCKVIAEIPKDNWVARHLAVAIGFTREGVLTSCFLRGGKLLDIVVFGVTRDAWNR